MKLSQTKNFTWALVATLAASLLSAQGAWALPLLAENAAQNVNGILTLYPDHKNPNQFYFMPNSSTFAREDSTGLPLFSLTYWGLSTGVPLSEAGAYMVLSMRLHSDKEQKAALDAFIAQGKSISVLPVQESTIGLQTTSEGGLPLGRMYEEFNFARKAGRAEDEVGVNAILTGIGAKVMKTAIESPASLKLDYCYMVQGLGPDFDALITLNWSRIYDHFQMHASGGGWWFKWQLDTEVEKLRQKGDIHIEINGGNAKDEEYVKQTAEKLAEKLFVAELHAKPTAGKSGTGWGFTKLSLKYTRREELKTQEWSFKRRDLIDREFCVPLVMKDISQHKDRLVRDADKN